MTQKAKSFAGGAALLAGAGLVGKVIGAFYRVWLSALIGVGEGVAIYNMPYSVYTLLLVISSAGLPTAISRTVSARLATGDRVGAREVMRVARRVLFATGLIASALMFVLATPLAEAFGNPKSAPAFMALAPAIFIVCMISAYRGYFQGMQRMAPTALSQLIEQIGKIAIGFPLAAYMMRYGYVWGAVGAIAGITLSELAALVLMLGANAGQNIRDRDLAKPEQREQGIIKGLLAIAIPITIGSAMMPIVGLVDSALVQNRLQDAGFLEAQAEAMYGVLGGIVNTLINMPAVITLSLSIALVPAISAALAKRDRLGAAQISQTGLKLAMIIGMPAALGMSMLADPIVRFLYGSQSEEIKVLGAQLLGVMAIGVFFLSVIQTSTGIFQGMGRPTIPVVTMGIGIVIKIAMNYMLIGIADVNIMGAVYATLACYVIAAIGDIAIIMRLNRLGGKFLLGLLKPALATAGMGAAVWGVGYLLRGKLSNTTYLLAAVAAGVAVYAVLLLATRALSAEDLALMPGGRRLGRLLHRGKHRL